MIDQVQSIQESQYQLPYHYLPTINERGHFSSVFALNWGFEYLSYLSHVKDFLRNTPFDRLLDVGCGDGRLLCDLSGEFPDRALHGIDFSERAISLARAFGPDVDWTVGDVADDSLFAEKYDVITSIDVLEHIPPSELAAFVSAISRRITDSGLLVVTVPSTNVPVQDKHYQHFDLKLLEDSLKPHFVLNESQFLNKTGFATKVLSRMYVNRFLAVNSPAIATSLYRSYQKRAALASDANGKRIFATFRKA